MARPLVQVSPPPCLHSPLSARARQRGDQAATLLSLYNHAAAEVCYRFHPEITQATPQQQQQLCTAAEMRVSIALLVAMAVILSIILPEMEAASTRRRQRGKAQRFRGSRARFQRMRARRGRQDDPEAEADLNAVDGEEEVAGDEAMEELYNGCDWKTNIGGFLNFCKWRKWCADNQGITDFGPYGGVPASCPPEEGSGDDAAGDDPEAAAADEAAVEEEEAAPEARRRARARRGRKAAAKSARRTSRSKKVGRKGRKSQKKTRRFRG